MMWGTRGLALHKLIGCKAKNGNYQSEKSRHLVQVHDNHVLFSEGYNLWSTKTAKTETKTKRLLEKIPMFEERRKEQARYKSKVPSEPHLHGRQVSKWTNFVVWLQSRIERTSQSWKQGWLLYTNIRSNIWK